MDTKRTIFGMMLAMMVILGYQFFIEWLYKKNNWKRETAETPTEQVTPATGPSNGTSKPPIDGQPQGGKTDKSKKLLAIAASSTQPTDLGSGAEKDPAYVMQIQISPLGAAIQSVTLNQFKVKQGQPQAYTFEQPQDLGPEDHALATRTVSIDGESVDLFDVNWNLDKDNSDASKATYFIDIASAGKPIARVRKTYQLETRAQAKGKSEGYELDASLSIENLSKTEKVNINTSFNGPLSPQPEASRLDRTVIGGYENAGGIELDYHPIETLTAEHPKLDITKTGTMPLVWSGIGGTYFSGIVRPQTNSQNQSPAQYLQRVEAHSVHPEIQREHPVVCLVLTTNTTPLDAGQILTIPLKLFFGPKQRSLLNQGYFSAPSMGYDLILLMQRPFAFGSPSTWCGACAFPWLIDVLVNMLRGFQFVLRDWGLAIIALVCVVRLILHPITKRSQVNMMKMSKMGPEIERLKKKYGDDKESLAREQMQLTKEMGIAPVLGCLPMFLQMPIFIALWQALQSTFELRQSPFLWFGNLHLSWIGDLSQPDRLIPFGRSVPLLFGWHMDAINLLPMLVAVVSFINMKYTPRPPAATPEAEQQQKMMQWMTLIFPLMFYTFPAGLNLYYLTSTSLGIWEGKRIRKHIKDKEEADKAGRIIIDASPNRRTKPMSKAEAPEPKGGLAGWLMKLQERAEQMRTEQDKRKGK